MALHTATNSNMLTEVDTRMKNLQLKSLMGLRTSDLLYEMAPMYRKRRDEELTICKEPVKSLPFIFLGLYLYTTFCLYLQAIYLFTHISSATAYSAGNRRVFRLRDARTRLGVSANS
ncbi:hypothetical protein NQ315_003494 [Exocentrus adspersus]|uniref:Uncharacterized protein n=1 Tax=Exocentrus adspersus TaxID=1586481 RepID=A0AAV8V693_9CUCU|nr:hypothetical protein NQ315_003494 [Exocentrus adspersus]